MTKKQMYDIKEAATELNFSESYIRTLIRRGTLETTRVPLSEGSLVTKHMIAAEELDRFMNQAPHKTRRHDGRNKFTLYAGPEEVGEIMVLLRESGYDEVADLIEPANSLNYWPLEE